jgi:hypothetical protein
MVLRFRQCTLIGLLAVTSTASAQQASRQREIAIVSIPCAGRVVVRNDTRRDEWADVKVAGKSQRVYVRADTSGVSYTATTLFLGDSGDTVDVVWRGRRISSVVPSRSCFEVPREPPSNYPVDQGVLVGNLARGVPDGDVVPGLLLVQFVPEATHEQRASLIRSVHAQVLGGIPEPTPGYVLLVPDDSLGTRVKALHSELRRSPLVRRVNHDRLLPSPGEDWRSGERGGVRKPTM